MLIPKNISKKFIILLITTFQLIKSIPSLETVKFVVSKMFLFIPTYVITHTVQNVGSHILKPQQNQRILLPNAWVVSVQFSYKRCVHCFNISSHMNAVFLTIIKSLFANNFQLYIETINFVLVLIVETVSKSIT